MHTMETRIRQLAGSLRERLDNEPRVSVMDLGRVENRCGIVSFAVDGMDPGDVKQGLRLERVYVSTSTAGSTPLDAENRALPTVVRMMAGEYCTARTAPREVGGRAERELQGATLCATLYIGPGSSSHDSARTLSGGRTLSLPVVLAFTVVGGNKHAFDGFRMIQALVRLFRMQGALVDRSYAWRHPVPRRRSPTVKSRPPSLISLLCPR